MEWFSTLDSQGQVHMVSWLHGRDRKIGDVEVNPQNSDESTGMASSTRRRYLQTLGAVTVGAGAVGETTGLASAQRASWPQFGYDTANTGHAPDNRAPTVNATEQWSVTDASTSGSAPVVSDGRLFVTVDDDVYGYDLESGDRLWRLRGRNVIGSMPAVANGTVYVGIDNRIRAVSAATGADWGGSWSYDMDGHVETTPAVSDGVVYIGSTDSEWGPIYALDATSGDEIWSASTWAAIHASPAVANGTVYVGNDDGNVYAMDAATGAERWTYSTITATIRSPVVVGSSAVFVVDSGGTLHAIQNGSGLWSADLGVAPGVTPAVVTPRDGSGLGTETVYVPDSQGTMYALAASDGREQWTTSIDGGGMTPTVAERTVFVGTTGGTIHAFEASSGNERYAADAGAAVQSAPSVANGRMYVRTADTVSVFSENLRAIFELEPSEPKTGETITFDAAPSGPDQLISSYEWSINGQEATGRTVQTSFDEIDNYSVTLTVRGENGLVGTTERLVPVSGQSPTAVIEYTPSEPNPNETVTFNAAQSTDPDGEIVSYRWLIGTESTSGQQVEHTFRQAGEFHVQLTVEDETGKTDTVQEVCVVSEPTPTPTDPTPTATPTPPDPAPTATNETSDKTESSDPSEDELLPIGAGALTTLTGIAGWLHFGRGVPSDVQNVDHTRKGQRRDDTAEPSDDESESETEP